MLLAGGETENVPLYYHMYDNFQIQFEREEFCLVTGLKFGVEYSADYDDEDKPIPFRRRVFPSCLDGRVPAEILIPDEVEAGSGWWLSSRANFDGWITEPERRPSHVNRQNHYEVPSDFYRDFQEQRSGFDQMMKHGQNIFASMKKYIEDLNIDTGANMHS
nr:phospholipase-like protein [Tanacetum cinerariifolium]